MPPPRTPARRALPLLAVLALAGAAGCSSPGHRSAGAMAGSGSPWGGLVEEPLPPPEPLQGPLRVAVPSAAVPPQREFTAVEKERMDAAWALFRAQHPSWPEAREAWLGLGPEAVAVLADNLYRAMVAARARTAVHLVETARKELVLLGEAAVPVLAGGLATRAVRTSDGQEIRMGVETLHDAAEALSLIGPPAVPPLVDIARSGVRVLVREAAWALGNIADPRAEGALLELAADPAWDVRAAAVLALRGYRSAAARQTLIARLDDPEPFVARRAAEALAARGGDDALPGVLGVLERAVADAQPARAAAAAWTLRALTGAKHGPDPAAWRSVLRAR